MIDKLTLVKENLIKGFNSMSDSPALCILLLIFFFFVFYLFIGVLVDRLFHLHRSRTACKKIMKDYKFWQKALLIPHKNHCLHAKNFCRKMVNYLYAHALFFAAALTAVIIEHAVSDKLTVSVYLLIVQSAVFTLPSFVIDIILSEYPFRKRSPFRFEKYHHTKEYEKLR